MAAALLLSLMYAVFVSRTGGMSTVYMTTSKQETSCGSWIPYTDEKCLRIADVAMILTKQEAAAVCPTFAETEALDDVPRLVTVKSAMEQRVLKQFLFEKLELFEHVWLGIDSSDDGVLRWDNGSELYFNSLAEQNITNTERQCVQMESGQGIYAMGQWVRVNCQKRNVVVCEKTQFWSVAHLQNSFLSFKSKVEWQIEKPKLTTSTEVEAQVKTESLTNASDVLDSSLRYSPCGDWTPYKDDKCVKLIVTSGTQMKEDADVICQGLREIWDPETTPRLVTAKTTEEQKFLHHFLFEKRLTFDHVWLGLEAVNDTLFRWNDGTDLFFSNWAKQDIVHQERRCVQMESGQGAYEMGQWVRTNCKKRNAVVCEKTQTWTVTRLQNILLSLKLDVERNRKESEEKLLATKQEAERKIKEADEKISANKWETEKYMKRVQQEAERKIKEADDKISANKWETERNMKRVQQEAELKINAVKQEAQQNINVVKQEAERNNNANKAESQRVFNAFKQEMEGRIKAAEAKTSSVKQEADQKINNLLKNPVPVGFIYVQLPDQLPPGTLWPQATWTDVSDYYAGLFFRVTGGNATSFGKIQAENSPRVTKVASQRIYGGGSMVKNIISIPSNGAWSNHVFTGSRYGLSDIFISFQRSTGEVRPRNTAVIIWKRTS